MCVLVVTGVALDEAAVQVSQLLSTDVSGRVIGGLEVQVVLSIAEELRGGNIHPDDDLVGVTGLLDGRLQQLQSCTRSKHNVSLIPDAPKLSEEPFNQHMYGLKHMNHPESFSWLQTDRCLTLVVLQDVGGEASLISHVGGVLPVLGLDHVLQVVVDLNTW